MANDTTRKTNGKPAIRRDNNHHATSGTDRGWQLRLRPSQAVWLERGERLGRLISRLVKRPRGRRRNSVQSRPPASTSFGFQVTMPDW